ncbi:hypothetical protein MLD38_011166 [Melastoma candidum]|uniref:Uncharacterized protein n=1 Tax=Melastoma candidum TaxID=119954 RepID=A0ACB9R1N9_9MYRT|nr:hypothetical protein MLD38_011166 [Melastoma candidum]
MEEEEFSDPPSPELSPPRQQQSTSFDRENHVTFLEMMYHMLPSHYQSQEINHLTLAYFVVSGLDILHALDRIDKEVVSDWVLSFQARPCVQSDLRNGQFYGFHGSRSSSYASDGNERNASHLASTYCALAILKIVGYDMSKFDSEPILLSLRSLQQPDGSFMPIHTGAEKDLRFVYCAAAICSILNSWDGMDKERVVGYISNCQSYDGGFGLSPGLESHGGATYCAVASLQLMGLLSDDPMLNPTSTSKINRQSLLDWTIQRQAADGGIQGRPNKPSDTCYAFWMGAVLRILGVGELIDRDALRRFLLTCQSEYGGFSKFPGDLPDLYHSFYGIAAFSLLDELGLKPLLAELGLSLADANCVLT